MILWKRAVLLGVASWFIPFLIGFVAYPLKGSSPTLFGNIMSLVVLITGGLLLSRYFRDRPVSVREALGVGALWFLTNIVLDYPMFAYGPMQMTAAAYYSDIGLSYLALPAVAFAAARLSAHQPVHREHQRTICAR